MPRSRGGEGTKKPAVFRKSVYTARWESRSRAQERATVERSAPERRAGRKPKEAKCQRDWSPQRKCNPCRLRTGGCLRSVAEHATSAPAESQPQQEPRKRQKPVEMYVPEALWDHRKDSNEAARKTAKPPPVTESPIVAFDSPARPSSRLSRRPQEAWPRASPRTSSRRSDLSSRRTLS